MRLTAKFRSLLHRDRPEPEAQAPTVLKKVPEPDLDRPPPAELADPERRPAPKRHPEATPADVDAKPSPPPASKPEVPVVRAKPQKPPEKPAEKPRRTGVQVVADDGPTGPTRPAETGSRQPDPVKHPDGASKGPINPATKLPSKTGPTTTSSTAQGQTGAGASGPKNGRRKKKRHGR